MKLAWYLQILIVPLATAQVSNISVSTTTTQAIIQYSSPADEPCTLKVADMNRLLTIVSGYYSNGTVTIITSGPHGLSAGSSVYIEGTGVSSWDGWQTLSAVTAAGFTFLSAAPGLAVTGIAGVLIDDVNPALFPGADLDSRPGNLNSGRSRVFVVGQRIADIASDGKRYSRAQQAYSRHHFTLTCGTQVLHQEYTTKNLPLGDARNDGPVVDRGHAGEYAYPTVDWTNPMYSLIDPSTGIRSFRGTSPAGSGSTVQSFQAAINGDSAWQNPAGPLTPEGGPATFTGPCQGASCRLFLRADNLALGGGATYTSNYGEGTSLDWVTVTFAASSISNGSCAGDACKVVACLTVDGVTCASGNQEITLTTTPASYTVGTGALMDLWQARGGPGIARPDVSKASGTVNYTASTKVVTWASGRKFSIRWGAGSRIVVGGTEYAIASVQSELSLTLASGPVGNLSGSAYSANNFGVLVWKKTSAADQVSVGYATFLYGSSVFPSWASLSVRNCGSAAVTVSGVAGYNCFIDRELYWVAADGSRLVDLGYVRTSYWSDGRWGEVTCGTGADFGSFDPSVADTWYCMILAASTDEPATRRYSIIKATYKGDHTARTNGLLLPDCGLNGAAEPCVEFIRMQPLAADSVEMSGPAFNSEFASSGYRVDTSQTTFDTLVYLRWGGISPDGDIMVYSSELTGQDTKGWQFLFRLGDRTPAGTNANSIRPVATASSYLHYPVRWCALHTSGVPKGNGWQGWGCNPMWTKGLSYAYALTLTSMGLNATADAEGGLNACPSNPYGISGKNCTEITVSGEPARVSDSAYLQDAAVGDVIVAAQYNSYGPIYATSEYMRVLVKTDSTHLVVQRGYQMTVKNHPGSTSLVMACGLRSDQEQHNGYWDYGTDPYGLNASGDTVLRDNIGVGGHSSDGPGMLIESVGTWYRLGEKVCPQALLGVDGVCYQVRRGELPALITATSLGVAVNPPFAGTLGIGNPNQVDSHPGPCSSTWCMDGRPMYGDHWGMLGSSGTPWVNTGGQLWKLAGGASVLHPKTLSTMAYVGRSVLVDISGPASAIRDDSTGSYQYCMALAADECVSGSAAGDAFVNAPYVSLPYCGYAGIGNQGDDTNSICVGPLGPYTGNIVQVGTAAQDLTGSGSRRLGTFFSRWNQQAVYWNASSTPNGRLIFSQVRWLDGLRHEDVISIVPPYPAGDSIARNTFLPVEVQISPPPERLVDNVVVEFGYRENGSPDSFFCTSRQETCVAVGTKVNEQNPFFFAKSENFSGAACASGCTVTIPALSQRVLYYRWKYRDASGQVVVVSDTRAIATP